MPSTRGRIWQKILLVAITTVFFSAMQLTGALAATPVTLNLSQTTAQPGDSIIASGTYYEPDQWVSIKVIDKKGNIAYYEAVKSKANGDYNNESNPIIVPNNCTGPLTVVAGSGEIVAHQEITLTSGPGDATVPTWTGGSLTASGIGQTSLTLTWQGATDNVGVTGYRVYRNGVLLTAVTGSSYNVTGLSSGTSYSFTVQAVDAAGNESTDGPSTTAKTSSSSGGSSGGTTSGTKTPVVSSTGSATVAPGTGGTVSLGEEASIKIPAGALQGTSNAEIKVTKVADPPEIPSGFRLAGSVFEFSIGGSSTYNFNQPVTLSFEFDPSAFGPDETPAIYWYDESQAMWVNIGGTISGSTITVQVNHLTKYAVMIVETEDTLGPVDKPAITLTDIAGHWAENSIKELVSLGIVFGYPDSSFKPDRSITRAEFAGMLVSALKLSPQSGKVFADTADHWAKDTIATAAFFGIVSGYDANTFGPDDLITREQMASMMVRALKLDTVTEDTVFVDSESISLWAKGAVATAKENGIMNGYADNTFKPQNSATRAEAVTVILKALDLVAN